MTWANTSAVRAINNFTACSYTIQPRPCPMQKNCQQLYSGWGCASVTPQELLCAHQEKETEPTKCIPAHHFIHAMMPAIDRPQDHETDGGATLAKAPKEKKDHTGERHSERGTGFVSCPSSSVKRKAWTLEAILMSKGPPPSNLPRACSNRRQRSRAYPPRRPKKSRRTKHNDRPKPDDRGG